MEQVYFSIAAYSRSSCLSIKGDGSGAMAMPVLCVN